MKTPKVIIWFYNFTTIGGITHARESNCKIAKKVWIVLFICGCLMTIWGVKISIESYMEYRSVTTVSKEYKSLLTFPSVTICNLNRVHCGNLNKMIEKCDKDESCHRKELYCKIFTLGQCDVALTRANKVLYGLTKTNFSCSIEDDEIEAKSTQDEQSGNVSSHGVTTNQTVECKTNGGPRPNAHCVFPFKYKHDEHHKCTINSASTHWCATKVDSHGNFIDPEWGECEPTCPKEPIPSEEKRKGTNVHEFWRYYLKLDHDEISEIAHQPEDMMIGCVFNKQVRGGDPRCIYLITNGGTKIFSPSYGVCYMFNFKGLNIEQYPAVTFYPGEEYGLQLTINVETMYYMQSGITEGQGIRITVENSTKIPFIVSEGINVQPRTSTNIGLNEGKHTRLPGPYPSNCSETYPPELDKYRNFTQYSKYSSGLCKNLCYVNIAEQICGCYFPYLEGNIPFSPLGKRYCDMEPVWNNTDIDCMFSVLMSIIKGSTAEKCTCNPECHETSYKKEISSSYWPTEGSLAQLAEEWGVTVHGYPITYDNFKKIRKSNNESYKYIVEAVKDHISDNYLKVNVYFATMKMENIVESPEINYAEFRNSLGGALALYLGISFVSFFEVVEFLIRALLGMFIHKYNERQSRSNKPLVKIMQQNKFSS